MTRHSSARIAPAIATAVAATLVVSGAALAADSDAGAGDTLETVTITAAKLRPLEQFTPTGSRLGLTAQELPATLETIDNDEMLGRGFSTVQSAADSQAGVISGGSPGDQSQFSMRGFTGNQITVLRNGLYVGPANMVTRDQNAFNVASVEILKGPASVLYGQGAVAGVVNVVDKAPSFTTTQYEALGSIGSFGTTQVGVGGTDHFGQTLALRADVSRTSSQGYVNNDPSDSTEATVTALWKTTPNLDVQLTVDFLEDHPSKYFGTPLVPTSFATEPLKGVISSSTGLALDKRMQFVNYNVSDARIHSRQIWPQLLVRWTPVLPVTIQNFTYYFDAQRQWLDAENYTFNTTTDLIDRDRFYVFHKQRLFGDQASASYLGTLFHREFRVVGGVDYSHLDFERKRGFPCGEGIYGCGAAGVDPFDPSPGVFGNLLEPSDMVARRSPTKWNDFGLFFENVIDLAPGLKLVTGGRYDRLELDRKNFDTAGNELATSFKKTYTSTNWRAGLSWNVNRYTTPYVSFTTGKDPAGTNNIFLVNAAEGDHALSGSTQVEAGIKARTPSGHADATLAVYQIKKSDMLVQVGTETVADASQTSKGVELSTNFKPTAHWTVSANAAYTDSVYTAFTDPLSGNTYSNVQPANIPKWTGNVWTSFSRVADLPVEVGGGVRFIGNRPGDTANTLVLKSYALVDAYTSYELKPGLLLTARVKNLLDKDYAQWADIYYPTEVMLGQPRTWELSIYTRL